MNNKDFDFDKVSKKMPYTIPEGLFEDIEKNVLQRTQGETISISPARGKSLTLRNWISAAACVLLLIVVGLSYSPSHQMEQPIDMDIVELAYDQLSEEDQMIFLSLSQDDIFLTDEIDLTL